MIDPVFDVTTAVAVLNQTLEYAYPTIVVVGEVSELRLSKGKWLYFDLKDELSRLKSFGNVYQLNLPFENGMLVEVTARPRLHHLYGFSLLVESIKPVGEGSIKKANDLLQVKLEKEGLFAASRKRTLPFPPTHIALVASGESAAFVDFIKILKSRWPHMVIDHWDVQVQGMSAEDDIVQAIQLINEQAEPPEVIVLTRGGGSAEDLAAFSTEAVARAVATSRIPTLVAIGHEIDLSLAELAADQRASTPSNAAELLVPEQKTMQELLTIHRKFISGTVANAFLSERQGIDRNKKSLDEFVKEFFKSISGELTHARLRLESYHPNQTLRRGYAIIRRDGLPLKRGQSIAKNDGLEIELEKQVISANVQRTREKKT